MRPTLAGLWAAGAVPVLLFLEMMAFGGDRLEIGLAFSFVFITGLALLLWVAPRAGDDLSDRALRPLYWLFGALTLLVCAQLAPWPTGMAKDAWAAVVAAPAITIDKFATVAELIKLWGLAAVFLAGVLAAANPLRASRCLVLIGGLGLVYTVFSLAKFFMFEANVRSGTTPRLAGSLLNPNNTAAFMALLAILAFAAALRAARSAGGAPRGGASKALPLLGALAPWVAIIVAACWAAAMTGSRGGAIAALAGLAATGIAAGWSRPDRAVPAGRSQLIPWMVVLIPVVAAALLYGTGNVGARLKLESDGVVNRQGIIDLYASRLEYVPGAGFGLGTFHRFNNTILGSTDADMLWQFGAMHNVFLQWIYEAGWLGAAAMFACIAWILAVVAWGLLHRRFDDAWVTGGLGVSVLLLTHGAIDFDLQIPAIAGFWAFILGVAFAAARRPRAAGAATPFRRAAAPQGQTPNARTDRARTTADR